MMIPEDKSHITFVYRPSDDPNKIAFYNVAGEFGGVIGMDDGISDIKSCLPDSDYAIQCLINLYQFCPDDYLIMRM